MSGEDWRKGHPQIINEGAFNQDGDGKETGSISSDEKGQSSRHNNDKVTLAEHRAGAGCWGLICPLQQPCGTEVPSSSSEQLSSAWRGEGQVFACSFAHKPNSVLRLEIISRKWVFPISVSYTTDFWKIIQLGEIVCRSLIRVSFSLFLCMNH